MRELCTWSVAALSRGLAEGVVTSAEITRAYLDAIAQRDGAIHAYLEVFAGEAMESARQSDARRAAHAALSPLDGVPLAVKDNIAIRGHVCSCASRMLETYVSPYDAAAIERVRAAGMPILGRLNMDEFAMGSATDTGAFGPTRNPVDPTRVPGGSSGGCAAAVAAGLAPIALGSDTGGSVRQPAAFCGVTGVKPAYGAISRWGLVAFASSLDQIGVLAKSAGDAALLLSLLCGADARDRTSDPALAFAPGAPLEDARGWTIGLPEECVEKGLDDEVRAAVERTARRLEALGARVRRVSLPLLRYALPAYYVLSAAEASSNLARYDGVRYGHRARAYADLDELYRQSREEGFGMEVKRRILLGTFALSAGYQDAYYLRAQRVRDALRAQTDALLETCGALLTPVTPAPAWRFGEKTDPVERYLGDLYTVPANLTGLPAVSLPLARTRGGLPIGVGFLGRRHGLSQLLALCGLLEEGGETA